MSANVPREPNLFSTYQDMFLNHQKMMPYTGLAQTLTQTTRRVLDAQIAYAQTIMTANAALLEAMMARPAANDIGPSKAAKQPDSPSA